jgi:type I restriction enzyme, S subunit
LLEGLEVSVILSRLLNDEFRFEAQFFRKRFLRDDDALARNEIVALGTFANVTDGPHGYHEVDEDSPIAMLTARSALDWFADRSAADTIAEWVDKANRRSSLETGDLILASRGTVGNCALVIPECLPANIDQDVGRISFKKDPPVNPEYLNAYLNCTFGQDHIHRQASGMVQQGISLAKIRAIPVPIFSTQFQDSIRDCTLEALAQRRQSATSTIEAEATLLAALGLAGWSPPEPLCYTARAADALTAARLDAQFYAPRIRALLDVLGRDGRTLSDIAKPRRDRFSAKKCDTFHYIEIGDVEGGGGLGSTLLDSADAPSRATWHVRKGDVLTSTVRPIRRLSAIVAPDQDRYVASSGFAVLQPTGVTPEVLMTFLRLPVICELMDLYGSASMYPAISESDILGLPVPVVTDEAADTLTAAVQSAFAARARSRALLTSAKRAVEIAIEDGEATALAFLDG